MAAVRAEYFVRDNESLELAIKRFRKKVEESGVLGTFKSKQYYEKPSTKRRKAKMARMKVLNKMKKKMREDESRDV